VESTCFKVLINVGLLLTVENFVVFIF